MSGYLGTAVQPGLHRYVFSFRPQTFYVGLVISLASGGIALALLLNAPQALASRLPGRPRPTPGLAEQPLSPLQAHPQKPTILAAASRPMLASSVPTFSVVVGQPASDRASAHLRLRMRPGERLHLTLEAPPAGGGTASSLATESDAVQPAANPAAETPEPAPLHIPQEKARVERLPLSAAQKAAIQQIAIVLALAFVPPGLVFFDRWLKAPLGWERLYYWWRSSFLNGLAYPPYFLLAALCLAGLIAFFAWRRPIGSHSLATGDQRTVAGNAPAADPPAGALPLAKAGFTLLWGSAAAALASFAAGLVSGHVYGWGFLLALTLYLLGWLLRTFKPPVHWRPSPLAVLMVGTHLSLVLLIYSLQMHRPYAWAAGLLLALLLAGSLRYLRRIPLIYWVILLAVLLFSVKLSSWEYSVIGDEYQFYISADQLATQNNLARIGDTLFSGNGVYGSHPVFSSLVQAAFMKVFGNNNFGWRFSNPYLSALALGFFYLFFRRFTSARMALAAVLFLATSHYLMVFSKLGYNNLQALFSLSLVLACASWAVQARQPHAYALLGLSLGLCFYVYPAALYSLPVAGLLLLFYDPPRSLEAWRRWGWAGLSLLLLLLPLFLQPDYWLAKVPGTLFFNPAITQSTGSVLGHLASNLVYSLFSFLYITQQALFVITSYVDLLTAGLVLVGLAYLLLLCWQVSTPGQRRFAGFWLLSFLLMAFMAGATHAAPYPPVTRMFLLLPWFAGLAAAGLEWLIERVAALRSAEPPAGSARGGRFGIGGLQIALALFFAAVLALNLVQAYRLTIQRSGNMHSSEVMFVRLLQELDQNASVDGEPYTFLFLVSDDWDVPSFNLLLRIYDIPAGRIQIQHLRLSDPATLAAAVSQAQPRGVIALAAPTHLEAALLSGLSKPMQQEGKVACQITSNNGETRFLLWVAPALEWMCLDER